MDEREARLARNEAMFRDVNEHIAAEGDRWRAVDHDFICECADASCTSMLRLTAESYEAVRRHAARFLVVPGHEQLEIETVVERCDGYHVVEKFGDAEQLVAALDPRS